MLFRSVTCNAALAIASRNAILQVIPVTVTERVYKAAQKAIVGDLSTEQKLLARRKDVLDMYQNSLGVTEEEVLKVLEVETPNLIREQQILQLVGLAQAIKDGDTTVTEAFGRNVEGKIAKETKDKVKAAIDKANEKRNSGKLNMG